MSRRTVGVPASRLGRWIGGFREQHAGEVFVDDGFLILRGADGHTATLRPLFPWDGRGDDPAAAFVEHVAHPPRCAVIIVRRGGFAAAVIDDGLLLASDHGRRHVQGRTAAGGWSQQRFARRRDKQVHELVLAAVGYVARVVVPQLPVAVLVTAGDRQLVQEVLDDPRVRAVAGMPRGPHLDVPDPRRDVVQSLPEMLMTARIDLEAPEA